MDHYGLLGFPLSHSFSKKYFECKFEKEGIDASYHNFELKDISDIRHQLVKGKDLKGFNVTIPYKEKVISYLDEMDEAAKAINAVNVVRIVKGKWKGFNTDWTGFKGSVLKLLQPHHTAALILGNGGASKAVQYALNQMDIPFTIVSRTEKGAGVTYNELDEEMIRKHRIVINTTPLGMHPYDEQYPNIPYDAIDRGHLCFDLIYNPEETVFLKKAKEKGAVVHNGYEMLVLQAEAAWAIWNQ